MLRESRYTATGNIGSIEILFTGREDCVPSHSFSGILDYYLFHFIRAGIGRFKYRGTVYEIGQGSLFAIFPGDLCFYEADAKSPWQYSWLAFKGPHAGAAVSYAGLQKDHPVVRLINHSDITGIFSKMFTLIDTWHNSCEAELLSTFYMLISKIAESNAKILLKTDHGSESITDKVTRFIQQHFQDDIQVNDIAKSLRLDRSYLSTAFKKQSGTSIKDYLQNHRLQKAAYMLKTTGLSVRQIANSCGYRDYTTFAKAFSRVHRTQPTLFRNEKI